MKIKGFHSKDSGMGALFEDIYIIDGLRSPFGKLKGSLSSINPTDLGILTSQGLFKKSGIDPKEVDQVICTNIGQESCDSFFLPRHIGLYSGVPVNTPALMVQRICGSGIEVIANAAEQIALNKANVVLGVGTEVMSRMPLVSFDARNGFDLGRPKYFDMLWEALNDTAAVPMGMTADNLAKEYNLTRAEVDNFAKRSQDYYLESQKSGYFQEEIISISKKGIIEVPNLKPRKYKLNSKIDFTLDENPRETTIEKLGSLPFVFSKDGPTTAGNASGIVDGACSTLIASKDFVEAHGLTPLGKIRGFSTVGVDPHIMGIGPVPAIESVLSEMKMNVNDIDLFEVNEAFSAQCLAVAKSLGIPHEKLNVHGGSIAIGHPLAATGLRLVTTCLRSLKRENKTLGVASACIGGGQGIAMVVERC